MNGEKYRPQNYDASVQQFGKEVTLIDAVIFIEYYCCSGSDKMDKQKVANFFRKAGFLDSPEKARRMPEFYPLLWEPANYPAWELATMYSIFCRGGKTVYPYIIRKISDSTVCLLRCQAGRKSFF